jgi:hypothetical protein
MDIAESSRKAAERAELLDDIERMADLVDATTIGAPDSATKRRLAAIADTFPFLAQYGRTMSASLAYDLGIITSCVRLGTIRTQADLVDRLKSVKARTQSDQDVLHFVATKECPRLPSDQHACP